MPSAVIDIREMLTDTLKYDGVLHNLLSGKKVYSGEAPQGSALNYIVLGQTTETPEGAGYYGRRGHLGTESIHCFARTKWTAQQIYARLAVILDDERPVVSGHRIMRGVLEYVTDAKAGEGKWQVWARYRVRTLVETA